MADEKATWPTAITRIKPNEVRVRGYTIAELMGRVSFGAMVYLIIRGELPGEPVARLMDAILVSSIDHGVTPPSCVAARTVATTGASLSAAVAAGITSINRHHGGAIEDCARQLAHIAQRCRESGKDLNHVAEAVVAEMKRSGRRMAGFGHRIHTVDPRTIRLFELAAAAGLDGEHIRTAAAVERVFRASGTPLPVNVDGAMAAILADLGFGPETMNGLFMIARTPGLVAHVIEEQTRCKPMRTIDPQHHEYDGPSPRTVPDG